MVKKVLKKSAKKNGSKTVAKTKREILAKELSSLIPDIDEEGLAFLVEQATVHLHNMRVTRLDQQLAEAADSSPSKKGGAKGNGTAKKIPGADFRIDRSPSGASYHIISGGNWKMFTDEEMLSMVNIAQVKETLLEVSHRLWVWLDRERPDALVDLSIEDHHDPRAKELVKLLRKKFAVRKK